ncbi:glycosyltransferase [Calothrix sp. PCC 7507]|uniref:glycosyltransferase n=1 Tax=Calothrix sp. PCC 7507 TaxID=99598 RepID=UPI00029F09DF|nr:glycosyltransferase [Calothrix sp. PCC 7507]AFY30856.1 glycosyl transferase group 1 [Calothrix sp. PCC 7507]
MKVLQVIPSISLEMGGPTEVVLNLVRATRQLGVDVEIVTTNDDGNALLDVPLHQRVLYKEVPIWFFPRAAARMKDYIFSADLAPWLWHHIRDYDLLETHYLFSYAPTCAGAIARRQKIPYLVNTMGQLSPWALAQSRRKKQVYSWLIERHHLNRAAVIHCTAAGEVEDVRNFKVKTPIVTLPLGVNQPHLLPDAKQKLRHVYGISPETPVVLFLSRLHYKKRPELLLQALSTLAEQNQDFHLILAGSGETGYENELKNLASSLGITNRVSFAGFVMGEDKDLLLQGSDFFVLPSFSENFGIAVAEAMAVGLPVVITPGVQIAPEVATAEAGLVVEGMLEPLVEAIAQLLKSPSLRQRLGDNGQQLVKQRYSWEAIAQNLSSVYSAVIHKKKLPEHLVSQSSLNKVFSVY